MTKAEFKAAALKVLEGVQDSEELRYYDFPGEGKGCLMQRIEKLNRDDRIPFAEIGDAWLRLMPTPKRLPIAPLSEIRAWVEGL